MAIILFVILAVLKKFFNDQVIGGWADVLRGRGDVAKLLHDGAWTEEC